MTRKNISTQWDRDNRNAINDNFKNLFDDFNNVVEVVSEKAYGEVVDAAKLNWKEPVNSYSDLPSEASEGDTRFDKETGRVYRFNGSEWIEIQQIDAGPVNEVDSRLNQKIDDNHDEVTSQLAQTPKRTEVFLRQYGININDLDEETRRIVLDMEPGEVNAVLGLRNVKRNNLDYNSVSPDITTFIKTSNNLINLSKFTFNKTISSEDGSLVDSDSNDVSEFIYVFPRENYTFRAVGRVAWYDLEGSFISSQGYDREKTHTVSVPENAYIMRLGIHKSTTYEAQINRGNTLLPYERYTKPEISEEIDVPAANIKNLIVNPEDATFIDVSTNLFDKTSVTKGKAILSDGTIGDNEFYVYSDGIPIQDDKRYTVKGAQSIAFYDENDVFISRRGIEDEEQEGFTFTPIPGASIIRINVNTIFYDINIVQMNEGDKLLKYEPYGQYRLSEKISVLNRNESFGKYVIDMDISGLFHTDEEFESYTTGFYVLEASDFYDMYDVLVSKHPDYITKIHLGNEPTGKPIYRYDFNPSTPDVVGNDITEKPKVFIMSGIHYEKTAMLTLYNTMQQICDNWQSNELLEALRFNLHFIIVPVVNPWGIDNGSSRNSNNVDLNHNFPGDWVYRGPEDDHYTGPEPLSELETQFINEILLNEKLECAIDFHNFFGNSDTDYFLWSVASDLKIKNIGDALMRRMTRKWRKDVNFIPSNPNYFVGYSGDIGTGRMPRYAKELDINYAGTFEICETFWVNPDGEGNDETVMKLGFEAFANYILMIMDDYSS